MTKHYRWALALRGRKGADIWERFLSAPRERQLEYLAQNGIPQDDAQNVLSELIPLIK